MIKNKGKLGILLISLLIAFTSSNVYAEEKTKWNYTHSYTYKYLEHSAEDIENNQITYDPSGMYVGGGTGISNYKYRHHAMVCVDNDCSGQQKYAYCLDPGFAVERRDGNHAYTCSQVKNEKEAKAYAEVMNISKYGVDNVYTGYGNNYSGNDEVKEGLAVRWIAIYYGTAKTGGTSNEYKSVNNYYAKHCSEIGNGSCPNKHEYNDAPAMSEYNNSGNLSGAWTLFKEAIKRAESGDTSSVKLTLLTDTVNQTSTEYRTTITVKSSDTSVKASELSFECENCSQIITTNLTDSDADGNMGTIEVVLNNGKCGFNIVAKYTKSDNGTGDGDNGEVYKPDGMYHCTHTPDEENSYIDYQRFLTVYATSSTTVECANEHFNVRQDYDTPNPGDYANESNGNGKYSAGVDDRGSYYANYCAPACESNTKIETPNICDSATEEETIKITAPEEIACIERNTDEAGNSYLATSNRYCSIYCKEDYDISLPGAQFASSGRYFELKPVVMNVKKTCYAVGPDSAKLYSGIEKDNFIKDVIYAQSEIIKAYNEYAKNLALKSIIENEQTDRNNMTEYSRNKESNRSVTYKAYAEIDPNKNSCGVFGQCPLIEETKTAELTGESSAMIDSNITVAKKYLDTAKDELQNYLDEMSECYNYDNVICLDPTVEFDYNETYSGDIKFEKTSDGSTVNHKYVLAKENLDKNDNDSVFKDNVDSEAFLTNYLACDENGCTNDLVLSAHLNKNFVRYVTEQKGVEYKNTTEFAVKYPSGTIEEYSKLSPEEQSKYVKNYNYLGAVFPLALKTETGVYTWTLKFDKLGQYFASNITKASECSNAKLGRLNDVAKALKKDINTDIGYACIYTVDCPDCPSECSCDDVPVPDGYTCVKLDRYTCVTMPPSCKDDCDVECKNCIFNGNDGYTYRTVSVNDLFPNEDREVGYNWTNEKGEETKSKIEATGEEIYKEPEYSYTITATQMKKIRDYNKSKGTYVADDLNYENITSGGKTFTNLKGISSFLNEKAGLYFTENKRNTEWTLWTGTINNDGSGPSWK